MWLQYVVALSDREHPDKPPGDRIRSPV